MGRTWADGFWRPAAAPDVGTPGTALVIAICGLSLVTLAMTFRAEWLFELTSRAAHQLLQREEYVRAVLGGTP
jgi:hypothetical protein